MEASPWLVVGLGNAEPRYLGNRHNIGFMIVDHLAQRAKLPWRNSTGFSAELATGALGRHTTILAKPQTLMNLSGVAVAALTQFYRVAGEQTVVIHDDVDLDFGRLKIKRGGGDGGHRGLRSISRLLDQADYHRVRFGVGRPADGDLADYVLSDFSADEAECLPDAVARAAEATRLLIDQGLQAAMNRFNRPEKTQNQKIRQNETSDERLDAPATPADNETISAPETADEA